MPRKIASGAVSLLDKRIASNTLAQACIANNQPRQLFIEVVKSCTGIKEVQKNKGVEVEIFLKTFGLTGGDMWCMAFLQTCLAYVEKTLSVQSPVYGSGACMSTWKKTPPEQRVKVLPLAGAIAIWQHVRDPAFGHTGMVLDCDGTSFHAIEGNVSAGEDNLNGKVSNAGDGVRFTHRRYDLFNEHYGDMLLLGCLKPF